MVGLAGSSAAASEWEMTGGLSITETTLDVWNDVIDELNDSFVNGFDLRDPATGAPFTIETKNEEKADNIDRVPMLFLGARKNINENWTGEIRYEYIFGTVEGHTYLDSNAANYGFKPGSKQSGEIDVKLHGITVLADYNINDSWTVGGGIGIYNGTKNKSFDGAVFEAINASGAKVTPKDKDFDLDAVSYRFGVGYKKAFAQNWDFDANLDYLYMEIDDEDDGNVYSKGFSYSLGVGYNF